MDNRLEVKNICFSYGNKKILKNISFSCNNGVIALLGANGAGKTTLMKCLVGLNNISSGEILLNNEKLNQNSFRKNIGYLPQHFDMYSNVSGYDLLSYVCDIKDMPKKDKKFHIEEIIEKFNLSDVIYKKIGSYSGGYKRRLGIAQSVIGYPKLLIVDEPTVGLDPEQRLEFRKYLSKFGNDRITIISTHITEDVELYSNQAIILKDGVIKFNNSIDSLLTEACENIYSINIPISDLDYVSNKFKIIEEKRMPNDLIRVKYISNYAEILEGSYKEKEVSLENAYLYFQK